MKGNSAVPGGPLTSKPTQSHTLRYATASAFFNSAEDVREVADRAGDPHGERQGCALRALPMVPILYPGARSSPMNLTEDIQAGTPAAPTGAPQSPLPSPDDPR